ncbi:MAG: hypothetical protein HGA50_15315 [Deltaproteobacteria bacterium]|jgi:hypothetical protein|nr:hypothetical protein [Deltaproteobacteria bacterium]
MIALGLSQLQILPQDLGLSRRKSLPLHQLSESLAYRTGRGVMYAAAVGLRTAYRHTMVFLTLSVLLIVLKEERRTETISWIVSIAGPVGGIT